MADAQTIALDTLLAYLRRLCALRSITDDQRGLSEAAEAIASLMQQLGFTATVIRTPGAPVVLAERSGRSQRQVLFYDHYDVAPPGPWRSWNHEPFELAEREGVVHGRGAVTKGNLVARLGAVAAILESDGELPLGVKFLIDGELLSGSPNLPEVVAGHAERLFTNLVVGSAGSIGPAGAPNIYAGVKGRLQVMLRAHGPVAPLPLAAASTIPNPAWRLLWALASVKSDAEEVLIDGFYDDVEPVPRDMVQLIRRIKVDEQHRLQAWQLESFLFEMSGPALARAEILNPTCNISAFNSGGGTLPIVPDAATALLDFTLVPNQRPARVVELLREHLDEHEFTDIALKPLDGSFPASRTPSDDPALGSVVEAVEATYGGPAQVFPMAPFALPLHLFSTGMRVPSLSLGLMRPTSFVRGPNEGLLLSDLEGMAQTIAQLLHRLAE